MTEHESQLPEHASYSALSQYRECPRKYQLARLEGWQSKLTARALSFGSSWHIALAVWYKTSLQERDAIAGRLEQVLIKGKQDTSLLIGRSAVELREEMAVLAGIATLPELDDAHPDDHRTHDLLESMVRAYCKVYAYEPWTIAKAANGKPLVEFDGAIVLPNGTPYYARLDLGIVW